MKILPLANSRIDRHPLLAMSLFALCATAQAAAPSASGAAYDFNVNVSVAGLAVLNVGPNDQVQFADETTTYEDSQSTASFDSGGGSGVLASLQTGALDAETQWLPSNGFLAVGSRASADDVNLGVVDAIGGGLLSLQAPLVQATTIITGTCPSVAVTRPAASVHLVDDYVFLSDFETPNLEATSTVLVQGSEPGDSIVLSINGSPVADIPSDPAVNTTVSTGIAGVTLILNERSLSGDGITGLGVVTNALHLNVNIASVITADVVLSHAEASVACN